MSQYVRAFAAELARVDVRLGARIARVVADENGFRVEGERFDQLIVATSSRDAANLLRDVPAAAEMRAAVDTFRHFETDIADPRRRLAHAEKSSRLVAHEPRLRSPRLRG